MLKIFDKNHNTMGHIVKYKDYKIESDVATGDKTLSFTYLAKHHELKNEFYIRTKDDEYVIKEISESSDGFPQITAVLNLEELQKRMWQTFSVTDTTIDAATKTVLAGTGWTIGECTVTKKRNAGMIQVSSLGVIQNLCTAFMCEPVFDTINKTVSFYPERGEDKGVYFLNGLNLKKLQKESTSYNYYTQIIPIGANGLTIESVNDGVNYLENYQYSEKALPYIWKDESYTDPQALKEDAELMLGDLSKPEKSYTAEVRDLAKQKPEYSILSYGLGDTITLIDPGTGTREKQRIKKLTEYPQNPEKNTCELANTVLTFEEMQQKVQDAAEIINYTIAGDGRYTGTINVSDILHFEEGLSGSSTIGGINSNLSTMQGELASVKVILGEVEANYLKVEEANIKYATIDLANIAAGAIKTAMIDVGAIQTAQIADGAITNLKVAGDLDATKITVGTLSVDRLIIRGTEKSIVYQLNNITGALQAQNVDTLNGEILTPRTINADKIIANSITGNEIAAKTITANNIVANTITGDEIAANAIKAIHIEARSITTDKLAARAVKAEKIDVTDLFAQDITATGTIRGVNLIGSKIVSESSENGIVTINNGAITVEDPNYPDSGVVNIQSAYICSSVNYTGVGKVKAYFSKGGFHIYQEDTGGVTVYAGHMDYNYISLSKSNVPFFKANETGIYEGNTLLADKYAAKTHTHSYLPLSGGTLTGNLSVSHSDTTESRVYVTNSAHSGKLLASSSGNFGLYDDTNSKWVVQSNSAGTVTLNGNATTATTLATARTLTIGNTGKSFNGSANVAWTLEEIGAVAATNGSPVWTIKDGTVKVTLRQAGASPSIGLSLVVTDASNNNTFYGLINSDGTCAWLPRTGGTLTGNLYTYAIYDNTGYATTTSNANYCCYVTSATNSNYHRIARYASSSRRYKNRISEGFDATTDYRNLLKLQVVTYHYNNGYITEDPAGEKKHIGFIVEDLDSLFPVACGYDEQGRPENWNAMEMIPGMLKLIQDQHEDTLVCKSRITSAEARMESLQYQLYQMLETINDQRGIIAFLSAKVERLEGLLQAAS